MQMMMAMAVKMELSLEGGMSRTVFPLVEEWLSVDSDRRRSLRHVGNGRLSGAYRSVIDAVFCKAFPEWDPSAKAFYADRGPPLQDQLTRAELDIYQYALLRVLEVAYTLMCDKRRESWGWTTQAASDPLVDRARALGPPPF